MIRKFLTLIISFYVLWIGVLPFAFTKTADFACKKISQKSDFKIELIEPKIRLSIVPTANIFAKSFTITSSKLKIDIKNGQVKIRILPLLSGKFHLNSLTMDELYLETNIKEDFELNTNFTNKLQNIGIVYDFLDINKFKIVMYQNQVKLPIIYEGENLIYRLKNRYVQFKLNSKLTLDNKVSTAHCNLYLPKNNDIKKTIFEINIKNIDISPLKIYLRQFLPKDINSLTGIINIQANKGKLKTELLNCSADMQDSTKSIIFPKKLEIISDFDITKKNIIFEKVNINSNDINLAFDGKVSDYLSKTKTSLDLNIQINPSQIKTLTDMMPAIKLEEIDFYKLKKYPFYGNIIGNFSIKGRLPEPEMNGDIYINNGILIKPIPNTKKGASVKLNFHGKHVGFDAEVPTGNGEKVLVKGEQELYNIKYADFTVKSSQNIDLHIAQEVLNPLHEILNFIIGPVPIMDINGQGNIDIQVKGNRKAPRVWGTLIFNNATAKFLDMPDLVLEKATSKLVFDDTDAVFTLQNGTLNDKDISIDSICNLFGKFDFDIKTKEQPVKNLYKALQTGKFIPELNAIPNIDNLAGIADIDLKIYGTVKSLPEIEFNKNVFAKGSVLIKNTLADMQKIKVNNLQGNIKIDGINTDINLDGTMDNEKLNIKAKTNNNIADIVLLIPKFNPNILIEDVKLRDKQYLPLISIDAKYRGKIDDFEYSKVKFFSEIISETKNNYINFTNGEIIFENNKLLLKNLAGFIKDTTNSFKSDLKIDKPFEPSRTTNGSFTLKTQNIKFLNELALQNILPDDINSILKKISFDKGILDLDCKIKNNKFSFETDVSGYELTYQPLELPIQILNGILSVKNNVLILNKFNILADKMPILLDGEVKELTSNPKFDLYLNSKPQQEFIDKYINRNQIYPIKIKGDIVYSAWAKGTTNDYDLKVLMNMSKDSSVYHFGATVGDIENAIALDLDSKVVNRTNLRIKDFSYDKLINSQSGKQTRLNQLKAWGGVDIYSDDMGFKELHIKTNTPTDARIFNIIFRKPNIKQGQFTSDLKINGKLSDPHVVGDFHIFETDIPFFDTTMKNINLVFKEKLIEFSSKGDVLGNDLIIEGVMKNKLTTPYHIEKASVYTKNLNLNKIAEKLKVAEVDNVSTFQSFENFDLADITFNNVKLQADSIQLRNINATNFSAETFLNAQGRFDMKNFVFNIAQGVLSGNYNYDLKTAETGLDLKAGKINANDISWALFDLNNQIYGDLTGKINLTCNGTNFNSCMQTLSGNTKFKVQDGKMPKLGSLEYLLKAGNLVKGGFTGLSISNIIDIVTPLKTGDFSEITGLVRIKDGVARNIEITTSGKDLSLFIWGTYNFSSSVADMEVFGYLSRKITNMFGVIGNFSMNTLFNLIPGVDLSKDSEILDKINKIPGLELSSKNYRKFLAEIQGNINGEDFVKSFRWIN